MVVRNLRRDANELVKEAGVGEDEEARALKTIQKHVDEAIARIDSDAAAKEKGAWWSVSLRGSGVVDRRARRAPPQPR